MQSEMVDKDGQKKAMLNNIRHQPRLNITLSRDDCGAISLQFGV